ncbi:MAG: hypothetical protein AB1657_03485 [Candidatus Micrarchaeota archaeon]
MAGQTEGLDYIIKKSEESAVQKFKNQNKILKKFGKKGLKVYKAVTRKGLSGAELAEKSGVPPEELAEIVSFMEKGGMVELSAEAAPPLKAPPAPPRIPVEEKPPVAPPRAPPPRVPAPPPRAPPQFPVPGARLPETGARKPEAVPPRAPPRIPPRAREEEIRPISEEELEKEEKVPEEKEKTGMEREEREEKVEMEKEEEIKPIEFEEEKPPAPPRAPPPRAPPRPPEEAAPPRAPLRAPPVPPAAPPEEEEYLTPSEKAIKERYGDVGLKVYSYIDGQRTAEQIMRETGVTEAQLIEMLDFMEKKGIIRLEHPERRRAPPPPPPRAAMAPPAGAPPGIAPLAPAAGPRPGAPKEAPKTMFAPMVEEAPELAAPISEKELAAVSLDVPVKTTKDIIAEVRAKAKVMLKFGKECVRAFELMDGRRDVVDLCTELKIPLYKLYDLLKFLQELKVLALKPAAREDIRRKYGEDGYSVYKKYGREGVLLYQLIGKEMSLKEMAFLTTTDPERVIEMFLFIHKLLGIELPIDEDVLRERLGIQKKPPAA